MVDSQSNKVDVVIVGAGYAGPLMAQVLAKAGKKVVVLEAGPAWKPQDLVSSQIWARRIHGPTTTIRSVGGNPLNIGFNIGWGLGGGGIHQFGLWPRMHVEDFDIRSRFGRGADWPISYDVLRSYYDRIQTEVGLSGDATGEVWRPPGAPYPMPPLTQFKQGDVLKRGFDAMGLRTSRPPLSILSQPFNGRHPCHNDGWCAAGCPIGAMANPLETFIPVAKQAGVEFRTNARALRVVMNRGRARGVEYADSRGRKSMVEARVTVLAAWTYETPRILLNSADGGLANSSGLVGRGIYPHILFSVFGLFPEETEPHRGPTGGQLLCQDMYDPNPTKGFFGGWQWAIGGAIKPNDLAGIANSRAEIIGSALDPFMRRAAKSIAFMDGIGFAEPDMNNALTLTDERDEFGMRKAVVTHTYNADAVKLYQEGTAQGIQIMKAAGADEAWFGGMNGAHSMGGTVMGNDPRTSVVNPYGQTHDVGNLFIAGAGTFPVTGAVNPTFTLNAWTLRSAEFVRDHWRDLV